MRTRTLIHQSVASRPKSSNSRKGSPLALPKKNQARRRGWSTSSPSSSWATGSKQKFMTLILSNRSWCVSDKFCQILIRPRWLVFIISSLSRVMKMKWSPLRKMEESWTRSRDLSTSSRIYLSAKKVRIISWSTLTPYWRANQGHRTSTIRWKSQRRKVAYTTILFLWAKLSIKFLEVRARPTKFCFAVSQTVWNFSTRQGILRPTCELTLVIGLSSVTLRDVESVLLPRVISRHILWSILERSHSHAINVAKLIRDLADWKSIKEPIQVRSPSGARSAQKRSPKMVTLRPTCESTLARNLSAANSKAATGPSQPRGTWPTTRRNMDRLSSMIVKYATLLS